MACSTPRSTGAQNGITGLTFEWADTVLGRHAFARMNHQAVRYGLRLRVVGVASIRIWCAYFGELVREDVVGKPVGLAAVS
jgi:hypothetical protein